jgi:LysR family glycine cleavage system transcriptional activator
VKAHLPLRAIQVFEAVGRCGSVTDAAEQLGVSPSAVTQQIHKLEAFLHVRLVLRCGRGIQLTQWGKTYLQGVAAAFNLLQRAGRDIERARLEVHLSVSALPSVANKWLGPLLFNWISLHPSNTLHLEGADPEPSLDDAETDFRISYGSRCHLYRNYAELFTDFVVPVASPLLLSGRSFPTHPRDLLDFPLLKIDWGPEHSAPPSWREWLSAFGAPSTTEPCDVSFSLSSAALDAAIAGRGLVLAQHSMVQAALTAGHLVQLSECWLPLPEPYFLAWNDSAIDKPLGAAFRSWLIRESKRFEQPSERS